MKTVKSKARFIPCLLIVSLFSCELININVDDRNSDMSVDFKSCGVCDVIIDTEDREYEGIVCLEYFKDPGNNLDLGKIEYKYKLETFFGEPIQRGVLRWAAGSEGKLNDITFRAKVFDSADNFTGWYYFYNPLVFSAGEWSTDVAGSPDWDEVFANEDQTKYLDASATKSLFINGFYLNSLYPFELNGNKY